MDREQQVRERAYAIWHAEGCPAGREEEHWQRALREIGEQEAGSSATDDAGANDAVQPSGRADVAPAGEGAADPPATAKPKRAAKAPAAKSAAKREPRTPRGKAGKASG